MLAWLLPLFGSIGLGVAGQLAFKQGVGDGDGRAPMDVVVDALTAPMIWGGLAAYGLSLVLWLWVLSRAPLNVAYPMLALGYVAVVILSAWALGERVPPTRWLAIAIIAGGWPC